MPLKYALIKNDIEKIKDRISSLGGQIVEDIHACDIILILDEMGENVHSCKTLTLSQLKFVLDNL